MNQKSRDDVLVDALAGKILQLEEELARLRAMQVKPAPTYSNPPMCSRCFCDAVGMEGARVYGMNVDDFRDHATKADKYGVHPSNLVNCLESRLEAANAKLEAANRRVKVLAFAVRMSGSEEAYSFLTQEERKL